MAFLLNKKKHRGHEENQMSTWMKDKHGVDPADGKTRACDRTRTFDTFVDGEQFGVARATERVGHTAELLRGLKGLWKKVFGKKELRGTQGC